MKLLCDTMCGKLARYLRMCGYDAAYALDRDVEADGDVAALARAEGRRLITRDASLAGRVPGSILLAGRDIEEQLREVRAAGLELDLADEPTRCGRCNGPLERVPADAEAPDYAPDPADEPVWRCRECGQHFWRGSHWDDVRSRLESL